MNKLFGAKERLVRVLTGTSVLVLFFVCGCSVGPDFSVPTVELPKTWPNSFTETSTELTNPGFSDWWKNFNDELLASLVERALQQNLDLQQSATRVRQARESRNAAIGLEFPVVGAAGQVSRGETAPFQGVTNHVRSALDAAWELDIFGGIRRQIEVAGATLTAAAEDRNALKVTLTSEVALAYFDLRQFQTRCSIARSNLAAQQNSLEIARKRQGAGFGNTLDVANAEAQVETTQSAIPLFEAQIQKSIFALSILLGQVPEALQAELERVEKLPNAPIMIPPGVPSDILTRRPDIRRSLAKLHAAYAEIGVAQANLLPTFSITSAISFQASQAASLLSGKNRSWSLIPGVGWPLFEGGRLRAEVNRQEAITEEAELEYKKVILTALAEVSSALVDATREREHYEALQRATEANERAVKAATSLYKQGNTEFLNLLSAQRALFSAQDGLAQSAHNQAANAVTLYKSLGGGWPADEGLSDAHKMVSNSK